ncbi:Uncharacterised protein [Bordetella pertussis]|nr:Uncharacterised protein [Bordetella pertussis]
MGERPGLAAEIAQVAHAQADFLLHLAVHRVLDAFADFDEAGQRRIAGRGVARMASQQDVLAALDQHHHGRRDAGVGVQPARGALQAQLVPGMLHGGGADAAVAMGAHPFGDLEGPAGQRRPLAQLGQQRAQLAEGIAGRRDGIARHVRGAQLRVVRQPDLLHQLEAHAHLRTGIAVGQVHTAFAHQQLIAAEDENHETPRSCRDR